MNLELSSLDAQRVKVALQMGGGHVQAAEGLLESFAQEYEAHGHLLGMISVLYNQSLLAFVSGQSALLLERLNGLLDQLERVKQAPDLIEGLKKDPLWHELLTMLSQFFSLLLSKEGAEYGTLARRFQHYFQDLLDVSNHYLLHWPREPLTLDQWALWPASEGAREVLMWVAASWGRPSVPHWIKVLRARYGQPVELDYGERQALTAHVQTLNTAKAQWEEYQRAGAEDKTVRELQASPDEALLQLYLELVRLLQAGWQSNPYLAADWLLVLQEMEEGPLPASIHFLPERPLETTLLIRAQFHRRLALDLSGVAGAELFVLRQWQAVTIVLQRWLESYEIIVERGVAQAASYDQEFQVYLWLSEAQIALGQRAQARGALARIAPRLEAFLMDSSVWGLQLLLHQADLAERLHQPQEALAFAQRAAGQVLRVVDGSLGLKPLQEDIARGLGKDPSGQLIFFALRGYFNCLRLEKTLNQARLDQLRHVVDRLSLILSREQCAVLKLHLELSAAVVQLPGAALQAAEAAAALGQLDVEVLCLAWALKDLQAPEVYELRELARSRVIAQTRLISSNLLRYASTLLLIESEIVQRDEQRLIFAMRWAAEALEDMQVRAAESVWLPIVLTALPTLDALATQLQSRGDLAEELLRLLRAVQRSQNVPQLNPMAEARAERRLHQRLSKYWLSGRPPVVPLSIQLSQEAEEERRRPPSVPIQLQEEHALLSFFSFDEWTYVYLSEEHSLLGERIDVGTRQIAQWVESLESRALDEQAQRGAWMRRKLAPLFEPLTQRGEQPVGRLWIEGEGPLIWRPLSELPIDLSKMLVLKRFAVPALPRVASEALAQPKLLLLTPQTQNAETLLSSMDDALPVERFEDQSRAEFLEELRGGRVAHLDVRLDNAGLLRLSPDLPGIAAEDLAEDLASCGVLVLGICGEMTAEVRARLVSIFLPAVLGGVLLQESSDAEDGEFLVQFYSEAVELESAQALPDCYTAAALLYREVLKGEGFTETADAVEIPYTLFVRSE